MASRKSLKLPTTAWKHSERSSPETACSSTRMSNDWQVCAIKTTGDPKPSSHVITLENLEKLRSTELYDAPLEGSTIFLYRSSLGRMSMESCRLAELKYAIFSGTCRKTKKLQCSKLFLSTVFKHGLLEGSTFLFQNRSITRPSLESSRLRELKHVISAG